MTTEAGAGDLLTNPEGLQLTAAKLELASGLLEKATDIRRAISVILRHWDYQNAKLELASELLEKATAEIERLRATGKSV